MYDSDEDAPPPLNTLPQQINALNEQVNGTQENTVFIADVTPCKTPVSMQNKKGLCRGFLSNNRQKHKKGFKKDTCSTELPIITAQAPDKNNSIPSFLKVPGAAEYAKLKDDLVSQLKPTPDTLAAVQKDPLLADAFSDPEVMAAVAEIASTPSKFQKYKNNQKVVKFYEAFGKLLGQKLQNQPKMEML